MNDEMLTIKVRGEDGYRQVTVRLKSQTLKDIEDIANRTGRSRNEVISLMLDYALPRIKIESDEE